MADSFPDVIEVRSLIVNAKQNGFQKDQECLARLRKKIIKQINDLPEYKMAFCFEETDFADRDACERTMTRICSELRQKGFWADWTVELGYNQMGEECWDGPKLELRVSKF